MKIERFAISALLVLAVGAGAADAQMTPWQQWTFLPPAQMDEIIGEISGETGMRHIMTMSGHPRDRKADEYAGTFREAQYVLDRLLEYGLKDAVLLRYPGGETWDGIKGELWETSPGRRKIASYQDLTAMLVPGSMPAEVTAELVWAGEGEEKDFAGMDVSGKIVVTSGPAWRVHGIACGTKGALGLISFASSRELFDPLQIPWGGIGNRRGGPAAGTKFAFALPPREGVFLRDRLKGGEKIIVRAVVESSQQRYEQQVVAASIPGTDSGASEIILTAHIFEGYTMFGANDNTSGCAAILEAARTLRMLIDEGRLPPPKRTIRFLWAPEISGTISYVNAHPEEIARALCNINLDMVGIGLTKSLAFFCFMRTSYGNPHYLNDVLENYYRYVGEATRNYVTNPTREGMNRRIVAPSGSEEPMYYYVGTDFGASDHMVFNDWAVGVPGIVMNTWPDQWYHTSEDRPDKIDPTQMKRAGIITAASAYTIASADDRTAGHIAAEIVGNAAGRLGHQLERGLEEMRKAAPEAFPATVKKTRAYLEAAAINERATLDSVRQLASDQAKFGAYLDGLKAAVTAIEKADLSAFDENAKLTAAILGLQPVVLKVDDLEVKAAKITAKPLPKVRQGGFRGYETAIREVIKTKGEGVLDKVRRLPAEEIHLLCNGRYSVLAIKKMLDTQNRGETPLPEILNYLEILKEAGLITY